VQVTGLAERCQDDRAGHPGVGGAVQHVAGVIVEPGEDLEVLSVGEPVVGEV
jgi:hypothetical protein